MLQSDGDSEEPHGLTVVTIRRWNNRWFLFVPFIFSFIFKKLSITYIPKKHLKRKKMTHEIICLTNPHLALSSCGDVRNVFCCHIMRHCTTEWQSGFPIKSVTGWRDISESPMTRWRHQSCWSPDRADKPVLRCDPRGPLQGSLQPRGHLGTSATLSKRTVRFHTTPKPRSPVRGFQNIHHSRTLPEILRFLLVKEL